MSKRSRRSQKRSFSQTVILILSGLIAVSMVLSLIIVALQPPVATPTPWPTWTPLPSPTTGPSPTSEASPTTEASPASPALPLPTLEPTEPVAGPEPATATPTITPTATITPSSAIPSLLFAVAGDSREGPKVFLQHPPLEPDVTDHTMAHGHESRIDLTVEQEVDCVFAEHIHAYAREEGDGVTYMINSRAGAPLYSSEHLAAFHHFLRVAVHEGDVKFEVVEV